MYLGVPLSFTIFSYRLACISFHPHFILFNTRMDIDQEPKMLPTQTHETKNEGEVIDPSTTLDGKFKPRQVSMLAIACSIGTGLIIGSGTALTRGGPASLLIAYCLIGAVVYFVMTALGEMAAYMPMSKGFSGYATRTVDPALG